uniref:Arginine/serine-rich protein PNISR n=1 Tax=Anopheles minimus TaxID=112268 RepID=A0A182VVB3_9DIPT
MMNRHGASNSNRPVDQGQLFSALMSDNGPNQGAFVPGSNAFSLAHYQNMPNDQVDWAALAQQWIKMRETWMQPMPTTIPSPPPPPSFDREHVDSAGDNVTQPRNRIVPCIEYEEQGEAPMEVEREDDGDIPVPPMPPKISGDWSSVDESWRTWSWPAAIGSTSALGDHHVPQALPNNQKLADVNQQRSATGPPPSAAAAIALWQAKNSHLFPVAFPKDPATMRQPSTANRRMFSTQPKPARLPGLMDREIKMNMSAASSVPPTDVQRIDSKENFAGGGGGSGGGGSANGPATINDEKRMMLPAWIREGLEKMEREKQQKLKREQEHRQREEKLSSQQNLHSLSLSPIREELSLPSSAPQEHEESLPNEENVALTEQSMEQITKKILTEIFMETTNEVLLSIAKEEQNKVQKRKGLGIYGDSDEDEEEEEDQTANDSNNITHNANASSDVESAINSDDEDSDTEALRKMMEKIRHRQENFKTTATKIEKWLSDVSENTSQKTNLHTEPLSSDDGSGDEQHGLRNEEADTDAERESQTESPRCGKTNTVVRKRRDKRVSRFSDPRDTVRTTHVTHVSIVSTAAEPVRPSKTPELSAGTATVGPSAVRPKFPAQEAKPLQLTAAQQSVNAYLKLPPGQSYQTIYSISAGPKGTHSKALGEMEDVRKKHTPETEPSLACRSDGGKDGESERKTQHYHDRKRGGGEDNDSGSHRRKYRDRSRSRSTDGSGSSHSRSCSAYSRSSRSTPSPNSHYSRSSRRHSSSKRSRRDRDRSPLERRSPSSGSSSRRHRRHSGTRSRSRSSSKYSSRRRF